MYSIIKLLEKEKLKYLLNGIVLNFLSYLFYLTFTYFGLQPVDAVIIVMPIMNLLNFYIQKNIVFKSRVNNKKGIFFLLFYLYRCTF